MSIRPIQPIPSIRPRMFSCVVIRIGAPPGQRRIAAMDFPRAIPDQQNPEKPRSCRSIRSNYRSNKRNYRSNKRNKRSNRRNKRSNRRKSAMEYSCRIRSAKLKPITFRVCRSCSAKYPNNDIYIISSISDYSGIKRSHICNKCR